MHFRYREAEAEPQRAEQPGAAEHATGLISVASGAGNELRHGKRPKQPVAKPVGIGEASFYFSDR